MAITIESVTRLGDYSYEIIYSSSLPTPTYYIYIGGKIVETTTQDSYIVNLPAGETADSAVVDIFDSEDDAPAFCFSGRLTINWRECAGAEYYQIDECVSGVWTERARVYDSGEPWFQWRTRFLEDVTNHVFKVTAVGENGNESDGLALQCLMVRHPDVPDAAYSYSAVTGKFTITIS